MDRFGSELRFDALSICRDISPRASGNTAFLAIIEYPTNDGFEIALVESISPYGVKLDDAIGGWANKHNRRTGKLLKGWFTEDCYVGVADYLRGKGGYVDSINATKDGLVNEIQTNPMRERIFIENITESGD